MFSVWITGVLRTLVPSLWGTFIAWLVGIAPLLEPVQAHLLGVADAILPILTALIIAAWYAFWRWLQPKLPVWAVRAVLGSAKSPVYVAEHRAS